MPRDYGEGAGMARRNRKNKPEGFIFTAPLAGVLLMLSTTALTWLWLDCRCESLGTEIRSLETERGEISKKCVNERYKWTKLKSPDSIETALARHGIAMNWPQPGQVVHLSDADMSDGLVARAGNTAPISDARAGKPRGGRDGRALGSGIAMSALNAKPLRRM